MQQTKPRFGHLLRPAAWILSGTILVEREGMDKRKIGKANEKRKKRKKEKREQK